MAGTRPAMTIERRPCPAMLALMRTSRAMTVREADPSLRNGPPCLRPAAAALPMRASMHDDGMVKRKTLQRVIEDEAKNRRKIKTGDDQLNHRCAPPDQARHQEPDQCDTGQQP